MPAGMITQGTRLIEEEEDRSPIATAIATILMQARAGGISPQQAAKFFTDMVGRGIPPQMIEKEIARDIDSRGEVFPGNQMPTDVRTPRPTMASYGDVRSVLSPGTSNIRVDQPDIGWPGEDFRNIPEGIAKAKSVTSNVPEDFSVPPQNRNPVGRAAPPVSSYVRPPTSFIHEDVKAAAQARSRTPTRQVAQNDPMGLWRTFGTKTNYGGNTLAVEQDAGYQTPREARRRPTYNRVPETKKSNRRYQPFAEMINDPWGIA